jgi:hypothetical protein
VSLTGDITFAPFVRQIGERKAQACAKAILRQLRASKKTPLPPTQRKNLIPRGPAHVGAKGPQDFYLQDFTLTIGPSEHRLRRSVLSPPQRSHPSRCPLFVPTQCTRRFP